MVSSWVIFISRSETIVINIVNRIIPRENIQVRMSIEKCNPLPLQPPCRAGVILARADMVEPCEGDILVPIRAVPQKRLVNPLGKGANRVAPAVVVPDLCYRPAGVHQRPHMSQTVYHIVAGVGGVLPLMRTSIPKRIGSYLLQLS